MRSVLQRAGRLVTPSKKIRAEKTRAAEAAFELVRNEAAEHPEIRGVEFGGSYPKDTWLPGGSDVDIFIKFDPSVPEDRFADVAQEIGFASLERYGPYARFSEHPYVEASMDGTKINVVPCYLVSPGSWKSSADRTQFHTEFMRKNLSEPMRGSVRLLKQFLLNNGIYGAEISQQGFSGYVAEVLVWNFGSFEGVVRSVAGAARGQVIGTAAKEFDTLVTIMDPVDPRRNLAAAISDENIGRFILLCRAFLKKPAVSFFRSQKIRAATELAKNCVVVRFGYEPRGPDVIWGQLKRAAHAMAARLESGGFEVIRSGAHVDGRAAHLVFLLGSTRISEYCINRGPDFFNEFDSGQFIAKNARGSVSMWLGGDRILALDRRAETDARRFLSGLLTEGLDRSGIPKGIKPDIGAGFTVTGGRSGGSIKKPVLELISTDATVFSAS